MRLNSRLMRVYAAPVDQLQAEIRVLRCLLPH